MSQCVKNNFNLYTFLDIVIDKKAMLDIHLLSFCYLFLKYNELVTNLLSIRKDLSEIEYRVSIVRRCLRREKVNQEKLNNHGSIHQTAIKIIVSIWNG